MSAAPQRDLPWGRIALVITGVLLVLLVERALRHEPEFMALRLDIVRPRDVVDDLSPIEWEGELPAGPYRFIVFVRNDLDGEEGELLRSPFLESNSWELPPGASDDWGRVRIRVYAVDPNKPEEELLKNPAGSSVAVIAWER